LAREKECYRDNIEQLNRLYPSHEMLSMAEIAVVLNCSVRSARKYLGDRCINGKISKAALARYMCG
jgi:hypothetical protein